MEDMVGLIGLVIPLAGILLPIIVVFIVFYFIFTTDYKKEKLRREERVKAIEAGVELPSEPTPQPATPLDYLRKGLVFLGVGLGLVIGSWIFASKEGESGIFVFTMGGFVLTFIGIALVIFYKIQSKSKD
jgi:NADH:ubiquinone oxidoreductase subunit 3 (subunit A)